LNKKGQYGAFAIQKGFSYAVCNTDNKDLLIPGKSYY
jgi:N4-(beta-N-acetylglucosaminyl)-L-asparaginase